FKPLNSAEFHTKRAESSLEGQLYQHVFDRLSDSETRREIKSHFPAPDIHRRNTGYAVDTLLDCQPFQEEGKPFNFSALLTGSEGTLAITTEIKIHVDPLPPSQIGLLCIHFKSLQASLAATVVAMRHNPRAVELMDRIVMDCTKSNRLYQKNRFFIHGDPEAVLVIEAGGNSEGEVHSILDAIENDMKVEGLGYEFPRVFGEDIKKVWDLRKAGLGLLSNVPGDAKPVAVIEDTAVRLEDLPAYIEEFTQIMERFGQRSVYYAHAGAGELHLRPILNLKDPEHIVQFHQIGEETAKLVKKYQGSLSGEHGDGRVRAEFIPLMVGDKNYALFKELKHVWDPQNLFNPGKIVDAPPMNTSLRYEPGQTDKVIDTIFDFSSTDGILKAVEKCNGSGDCRKSHLSGGTMCPSYMATRNERDTTRARANILREFLTRSNSKNPFAHKEIYEVMDLCLSCKGCTSECPSNVDMATLKAEFLHQYYKENGIPLRARFFANAGPLNRLGAIIPGMTNFLFTNGISSGLLKKMVGVASERELPQLHKHTLRKWYRRKEKLLAKTVGQQGKKGRVWFFCDEFTDYLDTEIGQKAIELLVHLGYEVRLPSHSESGRAHLSKGLLKQARKHANQNVKLLRQKVSQKSPLIGIEPSAILTFRDEYPKLVDSELQEDAVQLASNCFTIDEFIALEIEKGNIVSEQFSDASRKILLHGHCHQKALGSVNSSVKALSLPKNYKVEVIPSGCCGMAGSFGYEKEHYEISMNIGELVLFPTVRRSDLDTIIAAPGTSCRHQIYDGTQRKAKHPIEILWEARKK
ncbi:MAG: FAD-linked oxidase C-terminal domain-containing protein, partial [Bacteroidota bacterium]